MRPEIHELRADVEGVALHLYPVVSGALLLLAVPWLASSAAVFPRKPNVLVAVNAAWGIAAIAMLVAFRSNAGIVLDILE